MLPLMNVVTSRKLHTKARADPPKFWCTLYIGEQAISFLQPGPWPKSCMQSPEKNFKCLESRGTQFCSTAIQQSPCFADTSPSSHRQIDAWAFPPSCAFTFSHFINTSWFLPPHLPDTPFSNNPKTQIWIQKLDCGRPTWVAQLVSGHTVTNFQQILPTDFSNRFCLNQL